MKKLLLFGIAVFLVTMYFLIKPNEKIEVIPATEAGVIDLFWSGFEQSNVSFEQGTLIFEHKMDRATLAQIIQKQQPENEQIGLVFEQNQLKLVKNTKLFSMIPSQYILYLTPIIYEGRLAVNLEKVSLARIPITKNVVTSFLKQNQELEVIDTKIIFTEIPTALVFEQVTIQGDHLIFQLKVEINSFRDAIDLVDFLIPKQLLEQIL